MASRYGEQLKAGFSGLRRRRTEAEESGEGVPDCHARVSGRSISPKVKRRPDQNIVSAKYSVKLLYDIISRFDDFKRDLVKSIGFGGILCFPPLRQLNRRFAVWLMSKLDPRSQTLVIDDSRRIRFTKEDVFRVFGIPCYGRSVFCNGIPSKEVISKVMSCYLGTDVREHRSIKAAQEVIQCDYGQTMSVEEQNSFKAAFVIYVMSTLLSPGAKYDYASIDYWNALVEPSDIGKYDWGDYVIRRLFDAVVKVKSDMNGTVKVPSITGCTLFLQVLYLDSIDTGFLNMDHTVLPRVMFFGPENMRSMILADTVDECNGVSECKYGKSQLRDPKDVCYSWACDACGDLSLDCLCNDQMLWEGALSFARGLRSPEGVCRVDEDLIFSAAGPLYFAFADNYNETKKVFSNAGIRIMAVFVHIIEFYMMGFRYNTCALNSEMFTVDGRPQFLHHDPFTVRFESNCPSHPTARLSASCSGQSVLVSFNNSVCVPTCDAATRYQRPQMLTTLETECDGSVFSDGCDENFLREAPVWLYKHCMASRAMSQFYLAIRAMKIPSLFDLNSDAPMPIDCRLMNARKIGSQRFPVRTPFELGQGNVFCAIDALRAVDFITRFDSFVDITRPCISHYIPKYIEVLGGGAKMQLEGCSEMEMDLFDAVIRRFRELDDMLYDEKPWQRWRHFFESDVMAAILCGKFDTFDVAIRSQFIGPTLCYDVVKCPMLFFPGLVEHRWVCYVWNIVEKNIAVFDPFLNMVTCSDLGKFHLQVAAALKRAMRTVSTSMFEGCYQHWEYESVSFLRMNFLQHECMNRTGFLCAQFCFSYDGSAGGIEHYIENSERARANLLLEVFKMSSNHGYISDDLRKMLSAQL